MITLIVVFFLGVVVGHLETMRQVKSGHWEKYLKDNKRNHIIT